MSATNLKISHDNHKIIRENCYELAGKTIQFRHTLEEHQSVEVITPEYIADALIMADQSLKNTQHSPAPIILTDADSFDPDTDAVMNFANAYYPAGGYILGASGQEEALCRESTLYASISSKEAQVMYDENRHSDNPFNTEYMLVSPCVEVFRNDHNNFIDPPKTTAVISIPAPNLKSDSKLKDVSKEEIDKYMVSRLRQFLAVCAGKGYASLTLGAWGCGAFGHDAVKVAGYFHKVLTEERMARLFRKIVFAVKGRRTYNYYAFEKMYQ